MMAPEQAVRNPAWTVLALACREEERKDSKNQSSGQVRV